MGFLPLYNGRNPRSRTPPKKSENKKPLEEPFLALDPCKTNILELQQAKRWAQRINPTKYFVESYQSTHKWR